jgi:hypothetical protein
MRSLKLIFGLVGLALPVVYCGGLFFYFLELGGSVRDSTAIGLGPTLLGLGIVGLLFFIPLVLKSLRDLKAWRASRPEVEYVPADYAPQAAPVPVPEGEFDPDAALARYMARRNAADPAPAPAAPPAAPALGGSPPRPTFGRKIV